MPKTESFEKKLTFLQEELERMFTTEQTRLRDLNTLICNASAGTRMFDLNGAGDTSALEVAAGSMDVMMLRGARSYIFARYLDAIRQNHANGTPAEVAFLHLERTAVRELAVLASSLTSCSSSWVNNQRKNADLTAFGDVVRIFVDIAASEA
jgi:hypothetical protein